MKEWLQQMEGMYWPEEEQKEERDLRFLTKEDLNSLYPDCPTRLPVGLLHHVLNHHGLSREECLKRKKLIDLLFLQGKRLDLNPFSIRYLHTTLDVNVPFQIGFSVSKKNFRLAADRNLVKRKMREVIRANKSLLQRSLVFNKKQIILMVIFRSNQIPPTKEFEEKLGGLFKRLNIL